MSVSRGSKHPIFGDPENRRCAICWGYMELLEDHGHVYLRCPRNCQPGGHVSEIYVRYERARNHDLAKIVARNYPEIAQAEGIEVLEGEELEKHIQETINLLWGE